MPDHDSEVAAIERTPTMQRELDWLAANPVDVDVRQLSAVRDLLIVAAGSVSALVGDASPPPGADDVLKRLSEYEDTHDSIADRLLGWLVARDPAKAMDALETINSHLDQRMVRSAAAPVSEATTPDEAQP